MKNGTFKFIWDMGGLLMKQKVKEGQARVVLWDDIKDDLHPEMKVSPIAAIPHKSRAYRAILDLSFVLGLTDGGRIAAVNETTTKTAPKGACDQLGNSLKRLIHAFATTEKDAKVFMAKWDIVDGFWWLVGRPGEEWNFAYVLPQKEGEKQKLLSQHHSRWDGWNHQLISVRHRKRLGMWPQTTLKCQ